MSGPLPLTLALCSMLLACSRAPVAQEAPTRPLLSVACGSAEGPGALPRGHTVYADRRVVRWNGRSAASGGTPLGVADAAAHDTLWAAALVLDGAESEPVMGPMLFLDLEIGPATQRLTLPSSAQPDADFDAAFRACQSAVASAE